MKKGLIILMFIASIQTALSQSSKIQIAEIKTEISCSHCLECESCHKNIFKEVKANTKGVKNINVDSERNVITVHFDSKKTTLNEIEKAIALSGYKANELEPSQAAYEELGSCCKKQ